MRNIAAEPGASIRCLNCNARFVPIPLADAPPPAVDGAPAALAREPGVAGYWILRIPAMVYCAATLLWTVNSIAHQISLVVNRGPPNFAAVSGWLYLPILPLSGYFAVVVTRALARIEAASVKAAWKNGLLREALPSPPGSSLLYFGPLAASSGIALIVFSVLMSQESGGSATPGIAVLIGACLSCFLLAFMCADARQFFWRQQALAGACARGSGRVPFDGSSVASRALGFFAALVFVCFALYFGLGYRSLLRVYAANGINTNVELYLLPMIAWTLIAFSVTAYLLGWNFRRAVESWQSAASAGTLRQNRVDFSARPDSLVLLIRVALLAFLLLCAYYFLGMLNKFFNTTEELQVLALGIVGLTCLALLFSQLFADVQAWRFAQQRFWRARKNLKGAPVLPAFQNWAVRGTVALAFIQGLFMCHSVTAIGGRALILEAAMGSLLLVFVFHFPFIWCALVAREILLADCNAAALTERAA